METSPKFPPVGMIWDISPRIWVCPKYFGGGGVLFVPFSSRVTKNEVRFGGRFKVLRSQPCSNDLKLRAIYRPVKKLSSFSNNHGSGKSPFWRLDSSSIALFSTSMITCGRSSKHANKLPTSICGPDFKLHFHRQTNNSNLPLAKKNSFKSVPC